MLIHRLLVLATALSVLFAFAATAHADDWVQDPTRAPSENNTYPDDMNCPTGVYSVPDGVTKVRFVATGGHGGTGWKGGLGQTDGGSGGTGATLTGILDVTNTRTLYVVTAQSGAGGAGQTRLQRDLGGSWTGFADNGGFPGGGMGSSAGGGASIIAKAPLTKDAGRPHRCKPAQKSDLVVVAGGGGGGGDGHSSNDGGNGGNGGVPAKVGNEWIGNGGGGQNGTGYNGGTGGGGGTFTAGGHVGGHPGCSSEPRTGGEYLAGGIALLPSLMDNSGGGGGAGVYGGGAGGGGDCFLGHGDAGGGGGSSYVSEIGSFVAGAIQADRTPYVLIEPVPAPVVQYDLVKNDGTAYTRGTWSRQNVAVRFTCITDYKPMVRTADRTADAEDIYVFAQSGANQSMTYSCTDALGVKTTVTVDDIDIDRGVPIITLDRPAANGDNGWWKGSVEYTVTATNEFSPLAGAPVCTTTFNTPITLTAAGAGTWKFVLATDQNHNVGCTARNAAGGERMAILNTLLDATPPNVWANRTPESITGWVNGAVTLRFYNEQDVTSGFDRVEYSIDGGPVQRYGDPIVFQESGNYPVTFIAYDKAGNASAPQVTHVKIDLIAPIIGIVGEYVDGGGPYVSGTVATGPIRVKFNCAEAWSGMDGAKPCPAERVIETTPEAGITIIETIGDLAGNTTTSAPFVVKIKPPIALPGQGGGGTTNPPANGGCPATANPVKIPTLASLLGKGPMATVCVPKPKPVPAPPKPAVVVKLVISVIVKFFGR